MTPEVENHTHFMRGYDAGSVAHGATAGQRFDRLAAALTILQSGSAREKELGAALERLASEMPEATVSGEVKSELIKTTRSGRMVKAEHPATPNPEIQESWNAALRRNNPNASTPTPGQEAASMWQQAFAQSGNS